MRWLSLSQVSHANSAMAPVVCDAMSMELLANLESREYFVIPAENIETTQG